MNLLQLKTGPGFRVNLTDILFLSLLALFSYFIYVALPGMSLFGIPIYLGFTFFLFCNVFRIGNKLESLWYLPFTFIAVYYFKQFDFEIFWNLVLLILEPWKWVLIVYHIIKRRYCGIGYLWVNELKNKKEKMAHGVNLNSSNKCNFHNK